MTPDRATREKAAELAANLDKASLVVEEKTRDADDATYAALEAAETAATKAYDDFGHRVAMRDNGSTLCCPQCQCPILEEDMEAP